MPFSSAFPKAFRRAAPIAAALLASLAVSPAQARADGPPAPAGCVGPASGTWIRVIVDNIRNGNGNVALTLYPDDSSRFLAHMGSLYVGFTKTAAPVTDTCIFLPKPGVYAIAIYHDEDGDHKFGRSAVGLPAEGFGFSNNPPTLLGLPSFRSVRLNVPKSGLTSHIHLRYL
jgi:uncharacterized protein (DUF2141 family)